MRPWILPGLIACALMTASCATQRLISTAAPSPQIETPAEVRRPCSLYVLPPSASLMDLELGYATRGAQLVACDTARGAAVAIHDAEHALEARQAAEREKRLRPWWKVW